MVQRRDGNVYKFDTMNGLPAFSVLDKSNLWLSVVTTGAQEVEAIIPRLLPECSIVALDIGTGGASTPILLTCMPGGFEPGRWPSGRPFHGDIEIHMPYQQLLCGRSSQ